MYNQQYFQDEKSKLEASYRQQMDAIRNDYQNKMNGIFVQMQNQFSQPMQSYQHPQQLPINSEIQTAFMRSTEYQQNFNYYFTQFLNSMFFNQFQNSPFYAELKKFADAAYPVFEKKWIEAVNKVSESQEKTTKSKKDESTTEKN